MSLGVWGPTENFVVDQGVMFALLMTLHACVSSSAWIWFGFVVWLMPLMYLVTLDFPDDVLCLVSSDW